jgi:hypothetical protein
VTPDELADRLDAAADNLGPAIQRRMQSVGTVGKAMIRGNASGRPGPNIITGDYWLSWQAVTRAIPYGAQCTLGTDRPQGRRLEFGFVGPDSLGRIYNQPPFPHVGPAVPYIGQLLRDGVLDAAKEVLS